ncbi:MAG: SOS response-associated peptidase family protein [Christensenellales bacterium]|jgi:putative SOS response-associated peptidase YedK
MCGRYSLATEDKIIEIREIINEIAERYRNTLELKTMKTGEIFPTEVAPVLILGETRPKAALMKWGFPKLQSRGVIINARAETANEKKVFCSSLNKRRCVIPTTGFFEWHKKDGIKLKYLFRQPESKVLYLAGLFDEFATGNAYVILTAAANPSIAAFHNRMPMVLCPDQIGPWLANPAFAQKFLRTPCKTVLEAADFNC